MGQILSQYKKSIYNDIIASIEANTSHYYAFASHPISYTFGIPNTNISDYQSQFLNNWTLLFGKKIKPLDIVPVINNYTWQANTVYVQYDNTSNTVSNSQFYVIAPPSSVGGTYNVFKCINNANGAPSTQPPDQIQPQSFTKSDGYTWRYMYSIPYSTYVKFATTDYVPVVPNNSLIVGAYNYSGVENIIISSSGAGYDSYHDGIVRSVVNSTVIQIESTASQILDFYKENGIYLYNITSSTSQLNIVDGHFSNQSGIWVRLRSSANTLNIIPSITQYRISPRVEFNTDGDASPKAYTIINTFGNSVSNVVVIDTGYGITRANVSIISNPVYPSSNSAKASVYAIVPPPGGHGSNLENELNMQGLAITFSFNETESNAIPSNVLYNKIGIMKNPHSLTANATKGAVYTSNTFSRVLIANVSGATVYTVGDTVIGNTSNSIGVVAFSNSTQIYLTGDLNFSNNEIITSSNGSLSTTIDINTLGDIYTKDINPLYVQNIDDVQREDFQSETFKIVISI